MTMTWDEIYDRLVESDLEYYKAQPAVRLVCDEGEAMKPLTIPASTATTALAGAVSTIIVWLIQTYSRVQVPVEVQGAIITVASVLACHYTQDTPPTP